MNRSQDITSFSTHRQNLRRHFDQVRETDRPLFVTTNGETDAVVLSPSAYDRLADQAELLETMADIEAGLADRRAGRMRDAREVILEIAKRHGLGAGQ